jgi:O-antigen ligase
MTATSRDASAEIRTLIAALVIVLMPFPVILTNLAPKRGAYAFQAIVFPSDIALVALLVLCVAPLVRDRRRVGTALVLTGLLWLLLAASFAVHPSTRGALDVVRIAGTVALAWVVLRVEDGAQRDLLVGALVLTAVVQAAIALAQIITRSDIGLGALGEFPDPFSQFGRSALAPQGTMVHIYLLAGLALLAATVTLATWLDAPSKRAWLVAAGLAILPVGFTYSRAAAIGLVSAIGVLLGGSLLGRQRFLLVAAGALLVAPVAVGAIWSDGWSARVAETATIRSASSGRLGLESASTGRTALMRQARRLIEDEPVFGVGTGRYALALQDRHVDARDSSGVYKPVHDVPLLVAAEAGILAGLVFVALLGVLGWHALRAGPAALAIFVAYLPYVLLDHFPYTFPQGLVMTAVWVGVIERLHRDRRAPSAA